MDERLLAKEDILRGRERELVEREEAVPIQKCEEPEYSDDGLIERMDDFGRKACEFEAQVSNRLCELAAKTRALDSR